MTDRLFDLAAKTALEALELSEPVTDDLIREFSETLEKYTKSKIIPKARESLAVSVKKPKTAALAFDRVYRFPFITDPAPDEVAYYCATPEEVIYSALMLAVCTAEDVGIETPFGQAVHDNLTQNELAKNERSSLRSIFAGQTRELGLYPTIFYHNSSELDTDPVGNTRSALTVALSNLLIVDEDELDWEQILEFRRDVEARAKYRRLVRWLDREAIGRTQAEMEDKLATKLDEYSWSIRKHGMKAVVGSISGVLDPKFISGTSVAVGASAVAGWGPWALAAGGILALGKVTAEFGHIMIEGEEERRTSNYEIAYVHEVKKSMGLK